MNDNIKEISQILQQQLDVTSQDPNIFKLAQDKAKKLSENLALDINKPEVQDFISVIVTSYKLTFNVYY
jgi:hypothetical protein